MRRHPFTSKQPELNIFVATSENCFDNTSSFSESGLMFVTPVKLASASCNVLLARVV